MMSLIHMLIGLFLPACGAEGAAGLPVPVFMDVAHIERPATPNTALAAPEGFSPKPDIVTRRYDVAPDRLYAAIRKVAAAQERTFPQVAFDDRMQAHYVARSWFFNFPDLIALQVNPDSTLVIWSRSIYGQSDLGVNRKRVSAWLAALDSALAAS